MRVQASALLLGTVAASSLTELVCDTGKYKWTAHRSGNHYCLNCPTGKYSYEG
jgi:hypothetical protein